MDTLVGMSEVKIKLEGVKGKVMVIISLHVYIGVGGL